MSEKKILRNQPRNEKFADYIIELFSLKRDKRYQSIFNMNHFAVPSDNCLYDR